MPISLATALVLGLETYLVVGALFALWFAWRGAGRIDPVAAAGSWGFRLLVLPGATLLWPLLIFRLTQPGPKPAVERTPHRIRARAGR
ncbi:MAG: hypothetical protein AB7R55_12295 [Gemmatimonadales bacterium]